ncbi:MAG: DUF2442 domain-containing protein [Hyphomonadaceae bacterium]|nr:DUF2442 domain-containing protein [Hyphomonadaceae bacterium]
MSLGKIDSVAVVGPMRLEIGWDDGRVAGVDLREVIAERAALKALREEAEFLRVRMSEDGWSLEWPCGVDFGAPQLRRWADEQAGEIMAPGAFRAWMQRHRLTQEAAAEALGLSRRMIGYYLSGEKPVPKTVLLATRGWVGRIDA